LRGSTWCVKYEQVNERIGVFFSPKEYVVQGDQTDVRQSKTQPFPKRPAESISYKRKKSMPDARRLVIVPHQPDQRGVDQRHVPCGIALDRHFHRLRDAHGVNVLLAR